MWFIFALLTTLIWGLAELFYKKGANENEKNSHLKISFFVGISMGIHAIFILLTNNINYNWSNLIHYLPVSFCYIFSMCLSYFGLRYLEESISDPIENTSGALCTILCIIVLGKTINLPSIFAIIIIIIGVLGVGFLENHGNTNRKNKLGKKWQYLHL